MSNFKSERHYMLDASFPSCSGPCQQGRRACTTKDACSVPLTKSDLGLAVLIVAVLTGFVGFGPMVMGWLK